MEAYERKVKRLRLHHDARAAQVAMHYSRGVQGIQPGHELRGEVLDVGDIDRRGKVLENARYSAGQSVSRGVARRAPGVTSVRPPYYPTTLVATTE
eukprot:2977435-Prymnesium_polylepis.1